MTTPIGLLDIIRIASPCTVSWEGMSGDERARHCSECDRNVYNLSEMTRFEAESFLEQAEGRVCIRLYRRADGSVITRDCPIGAKTLRVRMLRRISTVAATGLALIGGMGAINPGRSGASGKASGDPIESTPVDGEKEYDQPRATMGVPPPREELREEYSSLTGVMILPESELQWGRQEDFAFEDEQVNEDRGVGVEPPRVVIREAPIDSMAVETTLEPGDDPMPDTTAAVRPLRPAVEAWPDLR